MEQPIKLLSADSSAQRCGILIKSSTAAILCSLLVMACGVDHQLDQRIESDAALSPNAGCSPGNFHSKKKTNNTWVFTDGCQEFPLMPPSENAPKADDLAASLSEAPTGGARPTTPAAWSLLSYQTPIRNQGGWGLCFTYAGIAALEAAYKRNYGLDLELSAGYAAEVHGDSIVLAEWPADRNCEDRNFFMNFPGGADSIPIRTKTMPIPEEKHAPTLSYDAAAKLTRNILGLADSTALYYANPTTEAIDRLEFGTNQMPESARMATMYGVDSFASIPRASAPRGSSLTERLEQTINSNHEVIMCAAFNYAYDQARNLWILGSEQNPATHCMALVAYDRDADYFLAKNSWGTGSPPNLQYMRISYSAIARTYTQGFIINSIKHPEPNLSERLLGEWILGFDSKLTIRRYFESGADGGCLRSGCRTKLGSYYDSSGIHEVHGKQVADGAIQFFIAPAGRHLEPGSSAYPDSYQLSVYDDKSGLPAVKLSQIGVICPTDSITVGGSFPYSTPSVVRYGGREAALILTATAI